MAVVASRNLENMMSENSRIDINKADAGASGGKENGRDKGGEDDPPQREESSSASSGSGLPHSNQSESKIASKSDMDATHKNDPDHMNWKSDAPEFVDHNGQPMKSDEKDPENSSGDSSGDENEDNEEERRKEKAERERFLAQGREENRKIRHGESNTSRPPSIERHWRQLYITVKTWWRDHGKALNPSQKTSIEKIQGRIEKECESIVKENYSDAGDIDREKKKLFQEYKFPVETLHGLISTAAAALSTVQKMETNGTKEDKESLNEEQNSLVKGVAVITETLKKYQIPAQCVVTNLALEMFDTIVNKSEATRAQYAETLSELNKPTAEQEEAWTVAIPHMEKALQLMRKDDHTSDGEKQLQTQIRFIESKNKVLETHNEELEIKTTTNSLPIALLQRMQQQWIDGQERELAENWTNLTKTLATQTLAKDLHQKLLTQGEDKMKEEKSPSPPSPPERSVADSSEGGSLSAGVSETSKSSSGPARTKPKKPVEKDYLSMQLSELDVITMPDYSDGKTEFGKLVAVRPCQTGNPRFSRFILHAGTENLEHYRVVRGSDLGPGGAETLESYEPERTHQAFNLRNRKSEMKENKIAAIGPCVVMSRGENYKPGPKSRRPDAYVKVEYADKTVDWVTRTEFIQLTGKKFADRTLVTLESKYKEKARYLEAHRQARMHPDTKKPLQPEDQQDKPWLFPDDDLLVGKVTGSEDDKEDADMGLNGIQINA
ncbi:hypothetical protein COCC4DRAFT_43964 [Bipolaris maydis ATCC 48331]|uniref:Uncharacterized protein n=2 Tax=Cochliobolus heterostrophus TaxID=5016 RepID=M2TCL2_COCH5|nr:uncharacterized protein COCC4DRAFT_43964 [Bipolaris maydis ATCC 48331]EMD95275.1 hypothetical protein COCHEDRAFT_1222434 [Bipolaris maydis C5]KAH7556193.1 hypothetical protein BM1_06719 [Bipolaris maydis]ENI00833.1 hypothetical protein COCC4DRAFT_43964 [Bipolaris maydis ATCC 48331]KAJ5021893.1 hypothetical protein J3E73DRAFT_219752 [Bipolaris maydis]KAJ5035194.1 hypothetical protein J3E74DRAFT_479701 [Bipolaris maydis]